MKWVWLGLVGILLLPSVALLLNRPPLFSPPGPLQRLKVYLGSNVAETAPDHPFSELRTPLIPADVERTRRVVRSAMQELGWHDIVADEQGLRAVVVTPIFRFRDDVTVGFEETPQGTLLDARSQSRVGRGDLAANAWHLQQLFAAVRRSTETPGD